MLFNLVDKNKLVFLQNLIGEAIPFGGGDVLQQCKSYQPSPQGEAFLFHIISMKIITIPCGDKKNFYLCSVGTKKTAIVSRSSSDKGIGLF